MCYMYVRVYICRVHKVRGHGVSMNICGCVNALVCTHVRVCMHVLCLHDGTISAQSLTKRKHGSLEQISYGIYMRTHTNVHAQLEDHMHKDVRLKLTCIMAAHMVDRPGLVVFLDFLWFNIQEHTHNCGTQLGVQAGSCITISFLLQGRQNVPV
jgi:hypothetical protein